MSATGKQVADLALRQAGKPYIKGGQGSPLTSAYLKWLRGRYGKSPYITADRELGRPVFDCSGLVTWCLIKLGVALSRKSHNPAWYQVNEISINKADLQPGDLVLKRKSVLKVPLFAHHIGIYLGDNHVVEAKGRAYGVVVSTLTSDWNCFRRIKGIVPPTPATYTVVKGDSWIRIAKKFGFKSYKELVALNGGKQFGLRAGKVLKLK